MKPQTLAMIVVGSVVGFFALAGAAVLVAWNLSPAEADNHRFVRGRQAIERQVPMRVDMAAMPGPDMAQMPDWNAGGFSAPVAQEKLNEVRGAVAETRDLKVSGPHTHDNLTLLLIHGPDTMKARQVVTLHEALNRGQA